MERRKKEMLGSCRPLGVNILGWFLIIASLGQLVLFGAGFDGYQRMFGYLPPAVITIRYGFSLLGRILAIIAGAGLLNRSETARRLTLGLGAVTLLTICWKHPFAAFQRQVVELARWRVIDLSEIGNVPVSDLAAWAFIFVCAMEIGFWVCWIYYLTRPGLKAFFVNNNR